MDGSSSKRKIRNEEKEIQLGVEPPWVVRFGLSTGLNLPSFHQLIKKMNHIVIILNCSRDYQLWSKGGWGGRRWEWAAISYQVTVLDTVTI